MPELLNSMEQLLRPYGRYARVDGPEGRRIRAVIEAADTSLLQAWDFALDNATSDRMAIDNFLAGLRQCNLACAAA